MPNNFQRYLRVNCGAVEVAGYSQDNAPGLRVVFKIEKTTERTPNTASVSIYNLSSESRASLSKPELGLAVDAGYVDGHGLIFTGDVRTVQHWREGASWVTKILAGDSERALRRSVVSLGFKGRTKIGDVVLAVAKSLGVGLGNVPATVRDETFRNVVEYAHGKTVHGLASDVLADVLADAGYEYAIHDNNILVKKMNAPASGQVVLLSETSGLIGAPEVGDPGTDGKSSLKCKALLHSAILPGMIVRLKSASRDEEITPNKVTYTGDTYGNDWFVELEAQKHK